MNTPICQSATNRRDFLRATAAVAGSWSVPLSFGALMGCGSGAGKDTSVVPLRPTVDESTGLKMLMLPDGFRYMTFGWLYDEMSDGVLTPAAHDGMGVIHEEDGIVTLVRNHEVKADGVPFTPADRVFDGRATGGCVNLQFDTANGRWLKAWSSLGGTVKNCAGGPTPWGTWLSCEESVLGPGDVEDERIHHFEREHGWIFEVPQTFASTPQPLVAMGRFVHEAVSIDPATGIVYETEDAKAAGCYRFLPKKTGDLAQGGRLQMMRVKGRDELTKGVPLDRPFPVEWVDIDDPTRAHSPGMKDGQGVYSQGKARQATTFARLEGTWFGNDSVYIVSTYGGDASAGQIFRYDPRCEEISLIFESPGTHLLDSPDNITVSPRGGIVLCEDGTREPQKLHGLTREGKLFTVAANNLVLTGSEKNKLRGDFRRDEWCGATFSRDGHWLFVNMQNPGLTMAITGPWEELGL